MTIEATDKEQFGKCSDCKHYQTSHCEYCDYPFENRWEASEEYKRRMSNEES